MTVKQKRMPWIMLACAVAMNFIFPGMLYNTLSVYTPVILKNFPEFSRSSFVFAITLGNLVTAAGNVIYPQMKARLGLRGMIALGGVCILSGILIYSSASTLPVFYIGAVLMGFSIATCASVTTVLIVNGWFAKRSGTLVSIAMSGTGIGCAVFSSIIGVWITQFGWRASMRICAGTAFVLLVILLILFRSSPEEVGLHRMWEEPDDMLPPGQKPGRENRLSESPEITKPEEENAGKKNPAAGTPSSNIFAVPTYRRVMIMAFLIGMLLYGLLSNMTVEAGDHGCTTLQIGFVSTVIFTVNVLTQIPVGFSCDQWGSSKVLYVTYFCYILALLGLIAGQLNFVLICLVGAVAGFGKTIMNNVTPFLVQEHVPAADKEKVLSICVALMTAGLAVGMYAVQVSYDLTGSYVPVYVLFLALTLFSAWMVSQLSSAKKA